MEALSTTAILHDVNNHLMLALNRLAAGDCDSAQRSIEACGRITSSFLDSARKADPKQLLSLNQVLKNLKPAIPSGIDFRICFSRTSLSVLVDPCELDRAINNLLFNAFEATRSGGTIVVGANGRSLWVSDTGCGVPIALHHKIFEAEFTTGRAKGRGLGLSIVRNIMHRHGGTVELLSSPGHGARFTLHFPAPVSLPTSALHT